MKIFKNFIDIIIKGEVLTLLPQKALYYKKEKALIVADIHLGKTGHFREAGMPVPAELAFADLVTLDSLLNEVNLEIEKLIVLGDLFHSKINFDWRIFEEWRLRNRDIQIQLIKGNHDILSEADYDSLNIEVFDLAILNKFILVHDYKDGKNIVGYYKICGHIHPGVKIYGKAKQALTLPCFYFGERFGILPAFGRFTGKHIIKPGENDAVFAIAEFEGENKIVKI